jgi:hypothetical protein
VDCLEEISRTEQLTIQNYLGQVRISAPVNLNYSESYWLNYHTIKQNGGVLEKGTPILVGKAVKQAIDELIEFTVEYREESGSDMLFLNKQTNGNISVRSSSTLRGDRDKLAKEGMPFLKFHQLRATFATILHKLGVPIGMIEKYLNHISSDVTAGYISSQRSESLNLFNKVLDSNISGVNNNEEYGDFAEELLQVIENSEFSGLTHNSQMKMFERLVSKHNVKLSSGDHGTCVLPLEKTCPNGYGSVNPCHTAECSSFKPDADEEAKQYFILSLAQNENKELELKKIAEEHGAIQINFDPIHTAIRSLTSILQQIEGE